MKYLFSILLVCFILYYLFIPKYIGEYKGWSVYKVSNEFLYKCNYREDEFYSSVNLIEHPNGSYINKEITIPSHEGRGGPGVVSRKVKKYWR